MFGNIAAVGQGMGADCLQGGFTRADFCQDNPRGFKLFIGILARILPAFHSVFHIQKFPRGLLKRYNQQR
jgi:hypothetical protein